MRIRNISNRLLCGLLLSALIIWIGAGCVYENAPVHAPAAGGTSSVQSAESGGSPINSSGVTAPESPAPSSEGGANNVELNPEKGRDGGKLLLAQHMYQIPNWPAGCESVSAVMAMQYHGVVIPVDTFIDDYLDTSSGIPFDPNTSYGGDPRSETGLGCYAPVIETAMNRALAGTGCRAEALFDVPLEELCETYIDRDVPVIVWATQNMAEAEIWAEWDYQGRSIQWVRPEHCLLLVGYDGIHYIFNDPLSSEPYRYYRKADVEAAYQSLFSQAVVIVPDLGGEG
jgi:uncharacterized protein YvpB